jgi:microcystin-dependent protein
MPKLAMRDPNTGTMVPILGGVDQATADARFAPLADPVFTGVVTAPAPTQAAHAATMDYLQSLTPVGSIALLSTGTTPSGWLLCQGQAISRGVYADLYAAIGTIYGVGDGSTTFNVPDLRNRIATPIYSGNTAYDTVGKTGGTTDETITSATFPASAGTVNFHGGGSRTSLASASGSISVASGVAAYGNPQYPQIGVANFSYGGGGGSHSNVQPSIALHYVIKF